jgi:hypothetical protein
MTQTAFPMPLINSVALIGAKVSVLEAQVRMHQYLGSLPNDDLTPQARAGVLIMNDLSRLQQEIADLQEVTTQPGPTQSAPHANDTTPVPAATTPAAVESGPCIICLEITTNTDGDEFLCLACEQKGWRR